MHIVFLTHEYPTLNPTHGGVGSVVQTLARKLSDEGHRISVIGLYKVNRATETNDGPIRLYALPFSQWKFGRFWDNSRRILRQLDRIHRQHPIDAVEGSELSFAFFPDKTPYKKVIRMHGGHHFFAVTLGKKPRMWRSFQEKQSFKKADALIAVSRYVGETTKKLLGFDKDFEVIYNIVDVNRFRAADPGKAVKGRIFFAGTVTEKKGIRQLVMAMPEIVRQVPEARLVVAGRDWRFPDGSSYMEYLRRFIDPSVKDKIEFLGPVPHDRMPDLIEQAAVCVYPSHMEAMPLAWIEVLAMGKPFVGGKIGPGYELVEHGKTGLLADPHSPEDIAEKTVWMLRHPDKALEMGQKARQFILDNFNPEKIVRQNIQFYQRLL